MLWHRQTEGGGTDTALLRPCLWVDVDDSGSTEASGAFVVVPPPHRKRTNEQMMSHDLSSLEDACCNVAVGTFAHEYIKFDDHLQAVHAA